MPQPSRAGNNLLRHCRRHPKLLGLLCVLLLGVGFGLWSLPDKVENHGTGDFDIGLTQLLADWGVLTMIDSLRNHAVTAWESTLGPEHPRKLAGLKHQAQFLLNRGDWAGAEVLLRRLVAMQERTLGSEHRDTLVGQRQLASSLASQGDISTAISLCRRVVEVQERTMGPVHFDTLDSQLTLATILLAAGDHAEAESLAERAVKGFTAAHGPDYTRTKSAQHILNIIRNQRGPKNTSK